MARLHRTHCPLCQSSNIAEAFRAKDHSVSGETFPVWDCAACSFRFTQDAPPPAGIGPYYASENYISHSDTKEGLVNRAYHLAREYMLGRKERLVRRVAPGKRVLDYGTGTGYFTDYLNRHGYRVEGIEIDEGARTYGSRKFGVSIHAPDHLHQGAKTGDYDAITLWHVLEHLYDPYDYLNRFRQLLQDRGVLVIAVPNHASLDAAAFGPDWAAYDVPRHLWHFTPKTMTDMLGRAGFTVQEQHQMPLDPLYVSLMSGRYSNQAAPLAALTGLRSFVAGVGEAGRASSVIYVATR